MRGLAKRIAEEIIFHTNDIESLKKTVLGYLKDGDLILAKASRGLALERFTEALFEAGLVSGASADAGDQGRAAETKGGAHAS